MNIVLNKDLYKIVHEFNTNVFLRPPPAYKETTLSGQKKRIQSNGELHAGNSTKCIINVPKGTTCTISGSKTKIKIIQTMN